MEQLEQVITALKLMEAGFTGAYRYKKGFSRDVWAQLLAHAHSLNRTNTSAYFTRRFYEVNDQTMRDCLSDHLVGEFKNIAACNETLISHCLSATVHVLQQSVNEIKIG